MLLQLSPLLSAPQLSTILAALNRADAPWVDGRVTAGHQGAAVKLNQQLAEDSAMARELSDLVVATLERNLVFVSAALPHRLYPPMFNRHGEGMHFGTHVDGSIRMLPHAGKLRTDLSATLFLSSRTEYDGGELVIDGDLDSRPVKLDAGDLVIYSATSRHRVNAVTRGTRLACVFWIQSLVRSDFERTLLFELDRTIQRLAELKVDPDSMVRLTAHYHGLLRLWAET